MIPKIIHYCWFGRNPLPESAKKCIDSWRKFLPDYEIKEWNEDNFDVNIIPYTQQAYEAKKYAFVSDYARFWILYHYGGVYFDTDVEVIKSMDDIIEKGAFFGMELVEKKNNTIAVNPGLGMASKAKHPLYKRMLDGYVNLNFILENGEKNPFSMIPMLTGFLSNDGLKVESTIQKVDEVTIYPPDFFNPWDDLLGILNKTANTRTIHWYSKTWMKQESIVVVWVKRIVRRVLRFIKR